MTVRSLDLLDLPFLPRYRQHILPLDSARLLTRGNPLGATALLSYLNPRRNLYTAVAIENRLSLMGQVILSEGETSARLTFLAPAERINGLTLSLLDHLCKQAGEWGALHVLAEVDEDSPAFKSLRQAGFAMFAWQRVWKLPKSGKYREENHWHEARETDWLAVQSMHGQIVPALLQPIECLTKQASGLVYRPEGVVQAFVTPDSGTRGVWLQPLIPPEPACGPECLTGLPGWGSRPVYVCVRSYQAWLESTLEELGAEPGPRQAVMVKRLAKTIKEPQRVPAMEKVLGKAKPAAPVDRIIKPPSTDLNHNP
ncbi:MAG: hypothetical protein AB1531_06290 [Chloroflexota bacterium]